MNSHPLFLDFLDPKSLNNLNLSSLLARRRLICWLIKAALDHTVGGLPKIGLSFLTLI